MLVDRSIVHRNRAVLVRMPVLLVITDGVFLLGLGQFSEQLSEETHEGTTLLLGIAAIHRTGFVKI